MQRAGPMTTRKYFSRKLKGDVFHLCKQIRNSTYGNRWRYMNTGARTPTEETVYLSSELEIRKAVSCSFFKLTNSTHTSCKCCNISPLTLVTSFTLFYWKLLLTLYFKWKNTKYFKEDISTERKFIGLCYL